MKDPAHTAESSVGIQIKIPIERLLEGLPKLFSNKVVIAFEGSHSRSQAHGWIDTFNKKSKTQLLLIDSLLNSLFVAEVFDAPKDGGQEALLKKTYAHVGGRFATFNSY